MYAKTSIMKKIILIINRTLSAVYIELVIKNKKRKRCLRKKLVSDAGFLRHPSITMKSYYKLDYYFIKILNYNYFLRFMLYTYSYSINYFFKKTFKSPQNRRIYPIVSTVMQFSIINTLKQFSVPFKSNYTFYIKYYKFILSRDI